MNKSWRGETFTDGQGRRVFMRDEAYSDTAALVKYVETCIERFEEMAVTLRRLRADSWVPKELRNSIQAALFQKSVQVVRELERAKWEEAL